MRISPHLPAQALSYQTMGKAIQAGATQSSSVRTEDILEISGLAQIATALGPEGLHALQTLDEAGVAQQNLTSFVEKLLNNGQNPNRVGDILAQLGGYSTSWLGASGTEELISRIEKKGMSGDLKYLDALDNLFNLGQRDIPGIFGAGQDMSSEEFDVYLKSVGKLLQAGVVGTRTVEFRGEPTQVFIENEIGSEYAHAPLYRKRFPV
jgi:hypothetical protein